MEIGNLLTDKEKIKAMTYGENQKQEDLKIIEAMEEHGGDLEKAIARLCYLVNGIDYMIIRGAYSYLFEEYKKFIK